MIILGIETSCDETALALLETRGEGPALECRVIASLINSQAELHSAYGGVFPTLAKREHGKNLLPLLHKLLLEAEEDKRVSLEAPTSPPAGSASNSRPLRPPKFASSETLLPSSAIKDTLEQFRNEVAPQNPDLFESFEHADFLRSVPRIDRIAVTEGPGLEPALWVGINFARMLGALWSIPVMPIDHMEGHVVGSLLPPNATNGAWHKLFDAPLPAIALLISGGHTQLVEVRALADYKVIGETRDDAVGEAFDKAARLLGLPYPGGPHLSELSRKAVEEKIASPISLPRPMMKSGDLDFSFSGLKTAVLYAVRDAPKDKDGGLSDDFKKGLAHEFEQAVSDTLDAKLRSAIEKVNARSIIVGGGVSANSVLRERFQKTADEFGIPLYLPSKHVSGDNALMIALAAAIHGTTKTETPGEIRAHGTKKLGV